MKYDEYQKYFWSNVKKRKHPSHPLIETMVKNKLSSIKEMLPNVEHSRILEVGAGNGYYSYYLEKTSQEFWATDFSENMIRRNPCHHKMVANTYALPFRDNSFDIIFETFMLHHLEYINNALAEMVRVTKKYIVILEPNALNPWMWLFALVKKSERKAVKFTRYFLYNKVREQKLSVLGAFTSGIILPNKTPSCLLRVLKTADRQKFFFGITNVLVCKKEQKEQYESIID
jgi:ubiquinone/menaquinone biosynthesis C-methylase UbiE